MLQKPVPSTYNNLITKKPGSNEDASCNSTAISRLLGSRNESKQLVTGNSKLSTNKYTFKKLKID